MLDKTFSAQDIEACWYAAWEQARVFARGERADGRPYTIVIPPPNVTGSLHMGHALNNTLQDILVRFERMRGCDVLWQPGTDHAGIATQMVVERQLAGERLTRHDLGREKFIERVWTWKAASGGTIIGQLRRLGASCDWSRERFTMDEGLSAAVRKVFVDLHRRGLIYRDKRLVNWDPKLETAISDLEVDSREEKGKLWTIRYPIEGEPGRFISVATTRPETLLGDTAVAVHPEDERYADLVGRNAILPIGNRPIPIVADEHADPSKGTGAVKITPAHDFNDFEVGRRHGLPMINVLDSKARLKSSELDDFAFGHRAPEPGKTAILADREQVGPATVNCIPEHLRGLDRYVARKAIVEQLEQLGLLEKVEEHTLMMPYGDRSGVVVEPWLMDQWFVDAATLAEPAIRAVEDGRVRFVPENWAKTYFEWMRNIQPWCISRQIWWGHQIPAWYDQDGHVFVAETEEEARAKAEQQFGDSFARQGRKINLRRDPDVLDTWFSSALWPFSTLGWPERTSELARHYPTDVLVTGFDIIFFWVARMMMMGLDCMGEPPFHTVYVHALVRDEKGQKMSKSKGNVIDPLALIDRYGADALRFTLTALAVQGRDVKLAEGRVEGYRNFCTKLWNAARFCQLNGAAPAAGFDPGGCKETVNRWLVGKLAQASAQATAAIEAYRFNEYADALYHFTWGTFCDWYLELAKPLLTGGSAEAQAETRATAAWALDHLLRLLHPVMPFVTEELFQKLGDRQGALLAVEPWPALETSLVDAGADAELDWVVRLISQVRALRAELNVPPSARTPIRVVADGVATAARVDRHRRFVLDLARAASLDVVEVGAQSAALSQGALQFVLDDATVFVSLKGLIDVAGEQKRLGRELDRLALEITRAEKKLANEAFVGKAPPEVVETERERCLEAQQAHARLSEALQRLASL